MGGATGQHAERVTTTDPNGEVLQRALAGDPHAQRELVSLLLPIVRARSLLGLQRKARTDRRGRDPHQECADLTQDVLACLFADRCQVLRAWDPSRGLSLKNFVGLVAARQVSSILRTGRRSPWTEETASEIDLVETTGVASPEPRVIAKEMFDLILQRLHEEASPRAMALFRALVVEEKSVDEVCRDFQMTEAAVYAWRSRLVRQARQFAVELQDLDGPAIESAAVETHESSEMGTTTRTRREDGLP